VSAAAETRSEIVKLARVLGVEDTHELDYLQKVPAAELRAYREAVTDLMYDADRERLGRTADAARLLPARTLAKIGEAALGPLICAHLSGLLEPKRAAEIAEHFSLDFLAQLAAELDPRRADEVVVSTSPERVVEIALALAKRGEYVAMGRFVAHLDEAPLAAATGRLSDEDLLRMSFVLEGDGAHERLFERAGAPRMRKLLAAAPDGLDEERAYLRDHLSADQRKALRARSKM
jgi:hypothetical protein